MSLSKEGTAEFLSALASYQGLLGNPTGEEEEEGERLKVHAEEFARIRALLGVLKDLLTRILRRSAEGVEEERGGGVGPELKLNDLFITPELKGEGEEGEPSRQSTASSSRSQGQRQRSRSARRTNTATVYVKQEPLDLEEEGEEEGFFDQLSLTEDSEAADPDFDCKQFYGRQAKQQPGSESESESNSDSMSVSAKDNDSDYCAPAPKRQRKSASGKKTDPDSASAAAVKKARKPRARKKEREGEESKARKGKSRQSLGEGEGEDCPVCGRRFKSTTIRSHIKSKHPDRYRDLYKGKTHRKPEDYGFTKEDLENPGNTDRPYKCPVCGKPEKTTGAALLHSEIHKPDGLEQLCPFCGKTVKKMDAHIYRNHPSESAWANTSSSQGGGLQNLICPHPECEKPFEIMHQLKAHLRFAHRSADIAKAQGVQDEVIDYFLLRREEIMGSSERQSEQFNKVFPCKECEKTFPSERDLRRHLWVHDKSLMVTCSFPGCGKQYGSRYRLKAHERVHKDKGVTCENCGVILKSDSMRRHRKKCFGGFHGKQRKNTLSQSALFT